MENNKSLLQITQEINEIEKQIILSDGEITPDIEAELNSVQELLLNKVDAYSARMEFITARAQVYQERANAYEKIARSMKNYSQRLKENIKQAMVERGVNELVGNACTFRLTTTKVRTTIDESSLPQEYKMVTYVPDKEKIADAVKKEIEVPGVTLTQGFMLRSYPK